MHSHFEQGLMDGSHTVYAGLDCSHTHAGAGLQPFHGGESMSFAAWLAAPKVEPVAPVRHSQMYSIDSL